MGRSDVRALKVPELPRARPIPAPHEVQAADALVTELRSAEPRQVPQTCPGCKVRLSEVEAKFGRCMGCGTELSSRPGGKISIGL